MNVKFDLNRVCNYMDSFYLDGKEYPIRCKPSVGDYGYFADSPKELETLVIENDFNMQNNNVQILEDIECYSSYPFISKGKQYSMFYVLRKKED